MKRKNDEPHWLFRLTTYLLVDNLFGTFIVAVSVAFGILVYLLVSPAMAKINAVDGQYCRMYNGGPVLNDCITPER